jgi:hypothetical protein
MRIDENKTRRNALFEQLLRDRFKGGYPHQHELWPCVRSGVAQRILDRMGIKFGTRKKALYFMRGESAEALIIGTANSVDKRTFVSMGVIVSPDLWTGDPEVPFREIKSTALSSQRMWQIVRVGSIDLFKDEPPMRSYFEQCAIYCVATGVDRCGLDVYFLHGDYADRRKKCPEGNCTGMLGEWQEDGFFRACDTCGYKSYMADLRSYDLRYTKAELAYYRDEVFERRRAEFVAAMDAFEAADSDTARLAAALVASPSFNHYCSGCEVGRLVNCENYGRKASDIG